MKIFSILVIVAFSAQSQDFAQFRVKSIPSTASFQYNSASLYVYSRFTENYEDSLVVKSLIGTSAEAQLGQNNKSFFEANKDSVISKMLLQTKLSISNLTTEWQAIKYRKVNNKDTLAYEVFVARIENEKITNDQVSETAQMLINLLRLKAEVFSQFEYEEPSKEYAELLPMTKQFKDSEGILDIDKLGAYLKTQPKSLEKYCDFE